MRVARLYRDGEYSSTLLFALSTGLLIAAVAFFAEIKGLHSPYLLSSINRRELLFIEIAFVLCVLFNEKVGFPVIHGTRNIAAVLLALWMFWAGISTLLSVNIILSLITYVEQIMLVLFSVSVFAYINTYRTMYPQVLWVLVAGFLLYLLFLISNYFLVPEVSESFFPFSMRTVGFQHIRHFGYYLAVMVIVGAGVVMTVDFKIKHPLFWLGVAVMALAWMFIVWLGGRGPIFAIGISVVIFAYMLKMQHYKRLFVLLGITLVLGIALSWFLPGGFGLDYLVRKWFPWWFGAEETGWVEYSSSRLQIWMRCLSEVVDNPVFGVGPNGFYSTIRVKYYTGIVQPHGFHIQAMLDWGVGGALLFFAAIVVLLRQGQRKLLNSHEDVSIIGMVAFWEVIMLLVFSSIDGTMYHRFSVMYFAFFMALIQFAPGKSHDVTSNTMASRIPYLIVLYMVIWILVYLRAEGYTIMPT